MSVIFTDGRRIEVARMHNRKREDRKEEIRRV